MTLGSPHVPAIHKKENLPVVTGIIRLISVDYSAYRFRGIPVHIGRSSEATLAVTLGRPHYDEAWRNYNELTLLNK